MGEAGISGVCGSVGQGLKTGSVTFDAEDRRLAVSPLGEPVSEAEGDPLAVRRPAGLEGARQAALDKDRVQTVRVTIEHDFAV